MAAKDSQLLNIEDIEVLFGLQYYSLSGPVREYRTWINPMEAAHWLAIFLGAIWAWRVFLRQIHPGRSWMRTREEQFLIPSNDKEKPIRFGRCHGLKIARNRRQHRSRLLWLGLMTAAGVDQPRSSWCKNIGTVWNSKSPQSNSLTAEQLGKNRS